ncbi:MAG: flavin reductase family protein [Reichenbachiella sp.]
MSTITTIDPTKVSTGNFHSLMLGAIAPRPIAFASTMDAKGRFNLSPFSFFNCFSANPPILIFSPARRVRDNTTKHTLDNVLEHDEVVINIVNHAIVEQMSLSSTEYDQGIDEFVKSGLTPLASELIKPPRVAESPVSFECKVIEVKPLGKEGGAGNLVICKVLLMHVQNSVLTNSQIDPYKLDAVARMGGSYYCRAQGEVIFEIPKPIGTIGIGIDQMPDHVRNSTVLTGNHLGRLGNIASLPTRIEIDEYANRAEVKTAIDTSKTHQLAAELLHKGEISNAWKVLLQFRDE